VVLKVQGALVFTTGGGATNEFMMEILAHKMQNEIIIPNRVIVEYKEALSCAREPHKIILLVKYIIRKIVVNLIQTDT
jgi:hypothetical protein